MSPEVRDELVSFGVAPASKFRVIRLGIELDERLARDGAARAETRRVMGIPDEPFWAPPALVDAYREACRSAGSAAHDEWRQRLDHGQHDAAAWTAQLLSGSSVETAPGELGIMRDSLFPGYQEDVGPFFAAFDVFVALRQQGHAGDGDRNARERLSVVATRVGGVPDVVTDGEDGFSSSPVTSTRS